MDLGFDVAHESLRRRDLDGGNDYRLGVGCIAGPAFAGFLAQYFGLAAPFVVAAAFTTVVTLLLTAIDLEGVSSLEPTGWSPASALPSVTPRCWGNRRRGRRGAVRRPRHLAGSTGAARLSRVDGSIRVAFSVAAPLFIAGSVATKRAGAGAVRLKTVLGACLVLALLVSPATLSSAPIFVVLMLCATSAARAVLWAVGYPLGAAGARKAGVGLGVVMGFLNLVWALVTVLSPLLAGALVGPFGARGTFAIAQVVLGGGLVIGWLGFHVRVPERGVRVGHL